MRRHAGKIIVPLVVLTFCGLLWSQLSVRAERSAAVARGSARAKESDRRDGKGGNGEEAAYALADYLEQCQRVRMLEPLQEFTPPCEADAKLIYAGTEDEHLPWWGHGPTGR